MVGMAAFMGRAQRNHELPPRAERYSGRAGWTAMGQGRVMLWLFFLAVHRIPVGRTVRVAKGWESVAAAAIP